jgi:hypothetical protein
MHKRTYSLISLAVLLGGSVFSYARMGTTDDRLIPYSGTLRSGNVPANGVYEMRFGLFESLAEDEKPVCLNNDAETCAPWGEQQTVRVSAGNFAVALGKSNPIVDDDLSSNTLYLAMAVKGPDDADFFQIGNHEIIPVPWATRAATATHYEVTGNLSVGGAIFHGTGGFIEMGERIDFHRVGGNGDYDARLHVTGNNTLQVAGADVTLVPGVGGGATGSLTADGNLVAKGNLSADGTTIVGDVGFGTAWGGIRNAAVGASSYALVQNASGRTILNAATGQNLSFSHNDSEQMVLDPDGNLDVDGTVQRTEYQTTCPSGLFNIHFQYCCRIDVRSGTTECKYGDINGLTWTAMPAPFSAGADGPYSLTCNETVASVNYPLCCRTGSDGGVDCAINTSSFMTGAWTTVGSPW